MTSTEKIDIDMAGPTVAATLEVRARTSPRGLKNGGNMCYLNASLQVLARTPGLMQNLKQAMIEPGYVWDPSSRNEPF